MTTIRDTITSVLPSDIARGNSFIVDQAVSALTEREYAFSEQIIDTVSYQFGVSKEEVKARVEQLGMAVRPEPEPEPVAPSVEELNDMLDAKPSKKGKKGGLAKRVKRLEKLAREHGLLSR